MFSREFARNFQSNQHYLVSLSKDEQEGSDIEN